MAGEVSIAREDNGHSLNGRRGSVRQASTARQSYRQRLKRLRNAYVHSDNFPTSGSERIAFGNLYTGKLTKSSSAKKEFLNHAETIDALDAAREAWNNPSALKRIRISPLGEGKDMDNPKDAKNIGKKQKRNITNFNVYQLNYNGRKWTVKTAQYKRGYETLYYIG